MIIRKIRRNESGFSLVELMIVVGIIGVLATLALPRFQQFQAKAKMAEARNMLAHIYTLEQSYNLDNNTYIAFGDYGRADSVTCTAPAEAKQLGFQINPCETDGAVPRFSYSATATAGTFTATATTGANDKNAVCPGKGAVSFTIDQENVIKDTTIDGATANCAK